MDMDPLGMPLPGNTDKLFLQEYLQRPSFRVINVRAPKIQENWVFRPFFPILQGKKF